MPVGNLGGIKKHGTVETGIAQLLNYELKANKDKINGYPSLDGTGKIPVSEIPSLSATYLPLTGGTMSGNIVQLGQINNVRSQSTNAIVTATDFILNLAPIGGNLTCTFPSSAGFSVGQTFIVRRNLSTYGNFIVIQSSAGELFNGAATITLYDIFEEIFVINIGGGWILYPVNFVRRSGDVMDGDLNLDNHYLEFRTTGIPVQIYSSASQLFFQDTVASATLANLNKFIGKSDTPASYSGAGTKMVRVNAGATALEFVTDDHITKADTSYFRPLYGYEGSVLQGTWSWVTNANQTNYSTNRNLAAGVWQNLTSHANNDEMAWHLYLGPGTYEIDVVYIQDTNRGKISLIWGPGPTLATLDAYGATTYNKTFSTDLVITTATYSYLYFLCNGKNALSSDYYIDFSRLEIFKKG